MRKNVNHLTFLGTPPLFTVDKFTPSSLQFLSEVETNESIISLCSMDNGDLLVGTADNILQIRDSQLNTLFTQAIDGQLIDVSVMSNCPVSLVRVKEHMYVKLYSRNITCPEKIKEWSSSSSETGLIAACGEHFVVVLHQMSLLYFLQRDGVIAAQGELKEKPNTICLPKANLAFFSSTSGIKVVEQHGCTNRFKLTASFQMQSLARNLPTTTPDIDFFPAIKEEPSILSKTKDNAGFCYAFNKGKIIPLTTNGKF